MYCKKPFRFHPECFFIYIVKEKLKLISTVSIEGLSFIKYKDQLVVLELFKTNFCTCVIQPQNNLINEDFIEKQKKGFKEKASDEKKETPVKSRDFFETETDEYEYKVHNFKLF